jgi:hypothetical protein
LRLNKDNVSNNHAYQIKAVLRGFEEPCSAILQLMFALFAMMQCAGYRYNKLVFVTLSMKIEEKKAQSHILGLGLL